MSAASLPLVAPLPAGLTAVEAFRRLARLPHVVFFDSALQDPTAGRYSYVAADPYQWIERWADDDDPLAEAAALLEGCSAPTCDNLPPFQGGVAGLLGYELARTLECIPAARYDDLPTPALALGAYDVVLAFDHVAGSGWLISQGFPARDDHARRARASQRLAQFQSWLADPPPPLPPIPAMRAAEALAPQYATPVAGVTSNLSPALYCSMVERAVEYIHAGDVFQVNLAQRLLAPAAAEPLELYLRLRDRNPAPYAGYLDLGHSQVASASPECFFSVRDGRVETRPIKGTRGRWRQPEADLFAGDELRDSEKDRAENVMIVDLMRNDLSRVCRPESVRVEQLCRLETYAFVKHLASVVTGRLKSPCTPWDLLRAAFPGGSITGAPKVRAMQIIAELEPTVRGPYCGSLAYVGFNGTMDASILIRTITAAHGWWQLPVGGGIVAQSRPEDEFRETWHKARGLLEAVV
ncbi:MAG TPA: aminodeoxychorismate synthase component I [Lacipirellulaceae bacterium]|nr:aminodeoxychorismate synthase component I [Lacipirellulaceae bacterium]